MEDGKSPIEAQYNTIFEGEGNAKTTIHIVKYADKLVEEREPQEPSPFKLQTQLKLQNHNQQSNHKHKHNQNQLK